MKEIDAIAASAPKVTGHFGHLHLQRPVATQRSSPQPILPHAPPPPARILTPAKHVGGRGKSPPGVPRGGAAGIKGRDGGQSWVEEFGSDLLKDVGI